MKDQEILSDTVLPPMLEFDVIYYFVMETVEDASGPMGEVRTGDINRIEIKDMSKSKTEKGHAFIIDTGKKQFHFNTENKFDMERWVEAIELSMQTAYDKKMSLTGACKNISVLVAAYD